MEARESTPGRRFRHPEVDRRTNVTVSVDADSMPNTFNMMTVQNQPPSQIRSLEWDNV